MKQTMITSPYADFSFYCESYFGDDIAESEFTKYAARGADLVDAMTWYRIPDMDESLMTETLAQRIRRAVCAAAEKYKLIDLHGKAMQEAMAKAGETGGLTSESNDGYSVSYGNVLYGGGGLISAAEAKQMYENEAKNEVRKYLAETCLLYRGAGSWIDT